MGYEFALAYIPLAKISGERLDELRGMVAQLPEDDLYGECDDPYDPPEEMRNRLWAAVEFLPVSKDYRREVYQLDCPDLPYTALFTGGLSREDDPTECFPHFQRLMDCPPIWERLVQWAKADRAVSKN